MKNRIAAALRKTAAVVVVLTAALVAPLTLALSSPAQASASFPLIVLTDWPGAFGYMTHHGFCEKAGGDDFACTAARDPQVIRFWVVTNFRGALRELRAGAAVTRERPHAWLAVPRFFG